MKRIKSELETIQENREDREDYYGMKGTSPAAKFMNEPVLENNAEEDFMVEESHSFSLRGFDRQQLRREQQDVHGQQADNLLAEPSRFSNVSGFEVPRNEDLSAKAHERSNQQAIKAGAIVLASADPTRVGELTPPMVTKKQPFELASDVRRSSDQQMGLA